MWEQAALLEMHGVHTSTGEIEKQRQQLLERIEKEGWAP